MVSLGAVTLAILCAVNEPIAIAIVGVAVGPQPPANVARPAPSLSDALSDALRSEGLSVLSGAPLRDRLLWGGRPLASAVERSIERGLLDAQDDYDRGEFSEAARRSGETFAALVRALPSARREVLARALQVLWGASVLPSKGWAAADAHFRDALLRDPEMLIDRERFAPPVQRVFEASRARVSNGPQVSLEVRGTPRATLFVDGIPRGALPLRINLPPHRCTLWAEVLGEPGLAHELTLAQPTRLSIDWDVEIASRFTGAEMSLWVPPSGARGEPLGELVRRVVAAASAGELLAIEPAVAPAAGIVVVRYDREGRERSRRTLAAGNIDWQRVARALREERERPLVAPSPAVPVLATHAQMESRGNFPWWTTGLIAGGGAVVAGAIALGFSLHPANAVLLGPETPRP
jgi:hypothetical protein